jgi:putative toxin-antitoxin system antitoxin component (TIGR02293 family)
MGTRKAGMSFEEPAVPGPSAQGADAVYTIRLKKPGGRAARKAADEVIEIKSGSPADLRWRTSRLLGGDSVVGVADPTDPYSAHEILVHGLPNRAVGHLTNQLTVMTHQSFERAIGISSRTIQRWGKSPSQKLSQEQGGRVWKFAELLTKATAVLGSQTEAEQWFERPAVGLNQERPIDLLSTPAGTGLVEEHLDRLAHGVYT